MRWSVSLWAAGDREMTQEEIVELADAVAPYDGIATGIGQAGYGAQLVVNATSESSAIDGGRTLFRKAAATAGLPAWSVVEAEAVSEASEEALEVAGLAAADQADGSNWRLL